MSSIELMLEVAHKSTILDKPKELKTLNTEIYSKKFNFKTEQHLTCEKI